MLTFVRITLAFGLTVLPSVVVAEKSPTKDEVDIEIFKHVEYPCHAIRMIKHIKEMELDFDDPAKNTVKAALTLAIVTGQLSLEETMEKRAMDVTTMRTKYDIDLLRFTDKQRMMVYHTMLSACIAGALNVEEEGVKDASFVYYLSSIGWNLSAMK